MKRTQNKKYSIQTASTVAGVGLLLMALLAAYGNFGVLAHLFDNDASTTALNIKNSIGSFRVAIVCLSIVAVLDVIVALALYRVFAPVNEYIARLTAVLRVVYVAVFAGAISQLIWASIVAQNHAYAHDVVTGDFNQYVMAVTSKIDAFNVIWDAGLIFFGLHLLLLGYLVYKASYAPKFLGVLLAIAGLGYFIDSIGSLFIPGYAANIAGVTFIGEVVLIFWLLIKGRRLKIAT